MPTHSFRRILSGLSRRALTWWARRPRSSPIRRTWLTFEALEERSLMAVLAPGMTWTDGSMMGPDPYSQGTYSPATVSVYNSGAGYLEVSGGGGAVSVTPYQGGSSGDTTGGDPTTGGSTTPPPTSGSYAVQVSGLNGYAGDLTWSGEAAALSLYATGSVSAVSIGGTLYVSAGRNIGSLSAARITASAGGNIGDVTAAGDVDSLRANGTIGSVSAGDDVGMVHGGGDVGPLTAAGDVWSVSAGGTIAGVRAGGDIGFWHPDSSDPSYGPGGGGVRAGNAITGPVTAGDDIAGVTAGGNIVGPVQAGGNIGQVAAGSPNS